MDETTQNLMIASRPELILLTLGLGITRMLGFLFGFVAFTWALSSMQMLRAAIAFALSLPLIALITPKVVVAGFTASALELMMLLPKEAVIGYAIGFIASLPFYAVQFGGAVVDSFRGESDSGVQDPNGGQLQTTALLHLGIAFYIFFAMNGLSWLVEMVYQSFKIWPIDAMLPSLSADAGSLVAGLITGLFQTTLLIMMPLLILLFTVELTLGFGIRLGQRFNIYDLSFLVRNLLYIVLLPLWALVIVQFVEFNLGESFMALEVFQGLVQ